MDDWNPRPGEVKPESSLTTEYDDWMTSEEAARFLRLSIHSLLNMVSSGKIRYYKLGRRNRYRRSDLQYLLSSQLRGGV